MKVSFITSVYLVTTNPYTKVHFSMLMAQISVLPPLAQRDVQQAAKTAEQEWPLLWLTWPMVEDFCLSSALYGHFGFHTGNLFFFSVEFSRPRKYSGVWYVSILSYHNVNSVSLVFLPTFFSLVHRCRRRFLPCMNCPEMMSEDILSLVYIYISGNV